jgi:hypothetical protein
MKILDKKSYSNPVSKRTIHETVNKMVNVNYMALLCLLGLVVVVSCAESKPELDAAAENHNLEALLGEELFN